MLQYMGSKANQPWVEPWQWANCHLAPSGHGTRSGNNSEHGSFSPARQCRALLLTEALQGKGALKGNSR